MTMNVYNHVRLGPPSGGISIDDAPRGVIAAIEEWLDGERRPGSESGVAWDVLPERRLSLLLLRHRISSTDGHSLELLHVVAVSERRLTEASEEAITGFFESLYGSPLSMALPKLLASLAGRPREEAAARARDLFADDTHLEALHWQGFGGPVPRAPERGGAAPCGRRRPARIAAGLAVLAGAALGVALAHSPLFEGRLPRLAAGPSPAQQTQERLARLEQRVERLVEQEQTSRHALSELTRSHSDAISQVRGELEALQQQASPVARQEEASSPPARSGEEPVPSVSPSAGQAFRVIARSARVRTGPSARERTRGLLGRGQRVVVTDEQDAWLEIEPPPGFGAPAWIHSTLVEAVEPASEEADIAPTDGNVGQVEPRGVDEGPTTGTLTPRVAWTLRPRCQTGRV